MSWATDEPGGFTEGSRTFAICHGMRPVIEATAGRRILRELLATSVGASGCDHGGAPFSEATSATQAQCARDVRGSAELTDELPEERIVELL